MNGDDTLEEKPEELLVLHYVKAAASASGRARLIMVVMVCASVLVFTEIWNTQNSWIDARLGVRVAALRFFEGPGFNPDNENLSQEDRDKYNKAYAYLRGNELLPTDNAATNQFRKQLIENDISDLKKIRTEQIRLIHIPFFSTVFDMNDMGIFAGITFVVVLCWLGFSLARERINLKLVFEAATKEQRKLCYELLAMQQVLTVPPVLPRGRSMISKLSESSPREPGRTRRGRPKILDSIVAKLLILIPFGVYLYQYYFDWESIENAAVYGDKIYRLIVANSIFLVLIAALTIWCFCRSWRIDMSWKKIFRLTYVEETHPQPIPSQNVLSTEAAHQLKAQPEGVKVAVEKEKSGATEKKIGVS